VSPPGPIQLIITELDSTPLTVLTVHWIIWGLPTIAPCMEPAGDKVTVNKGTVKRKRYQFYSMAFKTLLCTLLIFSDCSTRDILLKVGFLFAKA